MINDFKVANFNDIIALINTYVRDKFVGMGYIRKYDILKIEDAYVKAEGDYDEYGIYVYFKCEGKPEIATRTIEDIDYIKVCDING